MKFVSYAQNHEDVLLWRALRHVRHGFYVDVGANHPSDDSVTRAFYERGWSGINVEPLAKHFVQLQTMRPRDVNLQCALGDRAGEVQLFDTSVRGLATVSADVAGRHQAAGLGVSRCTVPMRRLDEVLEQYAPAEVHFLKIDVEGFERSVLQGMDFSRWQPWVVVVEATVPNSQELDIGWEPLLLDAGYRRVFFDGLNRYYLAPGQDALAGAFAAPPNVFDDFVPAESQRLSQQLEDVQAQLRAAQVARLQAQAHAQAQEAQALNFQQALLAVHASTSWRLTRPMRRLVRWWQARRASASGGESPAVLALAAPAADKAAGASEQVGGVVPAWFGHAVFAQEPVGAPDLLAGIAIAPAQGPVWWRFFGHVQGHYSLAVVNRGLALALAQRCHGQVVFAPFHGQVVDTLTDVPVAQRDALQALCKRVMPAGVKVVSIAHHFPVTPDPQVADVRLVMFFWEETAVPAEVVAQLNAGFDGVLVASGFVQRVLRNSGCWLPIFLVPLGVAHLVPTVASALAPLVPGAGGRFRFLHVSSAFERKGVDVLLKAFLAAYSSADAVELYVKTFANPHQEVRALWASLTAQRADAPRVVVDESDLDEAQLLALYESAQAMVLPTRGEGFNLPAAEALALGLPLVVTGFGAHTDFCTRRTALLLPFALTASRSHVASHSACWAEPDMAGLVQLLHQVHAEVLDDSAGLHARRAAGQRYVRAVYTWERAAAAVQAGVSWLGTAGRSTRGAGYRLALLSPWRTRCGIAEYSQNLFGHWGPGCDVQVFCDQRTARDDQQQLFRPAWALQDSASVCAALDEIGQGLFDTVMVQHQPSLFALDERVCARLGGLQAAGCTVILVLHATTPLLEEAALSVAAVVQLRGLARIVVHKPEDLNQLLVLGLQANVMLLPHGVVQPPRAPVLGCSRADWGFGETDLVLGCFGFLLPHKGVDTLVQCLPRLARAASGRKVRLLAVCSTLDERSAAELSRCQALAESLGVAGWVTWVTDFRPVHECIGLLRMTDCVVLPYRQTRESASGAVTVALAAMRPVLVSPSSIFSDVQTCTWKLAGAEVADVVAAVSALQAQPQQVDALLQRQSSWLRQRDWSAVALRLDGLLRGLLADRALPRAAPQDVWPDGQCARRRQLLVDVSELYFRDAQTGIQRVVRQVLAALFEGAAGDFDVMPVYATPTQGYRYTSRFSSTQQGQTAAELNELPVDAFAGDVFLGLDLSAHLFPQALGELKALRLAGVKVCFVVYDIIPLLWPRLTVPGMALAFEQWLLGLAQCANGLACISAAVADDTQAWLMEHAPVDAALPRVGYFHLGADVRLPVASGALPSFADDLIGSMRTNASFLMVGTVEPRKGQAQVLDAFELLWQQGLPLQLVLVGKLGWMMADFATRLRGHAELGKRLFWQETCDDAMLDAVYGAATALIAASVAEGFGLPLVEAAARGLPLIARDLPVFREVAGAHAFYFSGDSGADLAGAISAWQALQRDGLAPQPTGLQWRSWRQSAADLMRFALEL